MSDLFSIAGKTALVTGGSRGIGLMIARGFVEAGAKVYISSRKAEVCEEVAAELSDDRRVPSPSPPTCRPRTSAAAWPTRSPAREATLDILVNNAGATWGAPLDDFDEAAWDRVLDLNVKGVFHLTEVPAARCCRRPARPTSPARVINIGSIDGLHVPVLETYSYSASQGGGAPAHPAPGQAPGRRHITVNAIAPGPFESKMMAATLDAAGDAIAAAVPLKRIGQPDDMAGTAIFLSSKAVVHHRHGHPGRRRAGDDRLTPARPGRAGRRAVFEAIAPRGPAIASTTPAGQLRGTSYQGSSLSVRGSPGRPSTRSPMMLRWISDVPPSIELARDRRNILRRRPGRAGEAELLGPAHLVVVVDQGRRRRAGRRTARRCRLLTSANIELGDRALGAGVAGLAVLRRPGCW